MFLALTRRPFATSDRLQRQRSAMRTIRAHVSACKPRESEMVSFQIFIQVAPCYRVGTFTARQRDRSGSSPVATAAGSSGWPCESKRPRRLARLRADRVDPLHRRKFLGDGQGGRWRRGFGGVELPPRTNMRLLTGRARTLVARHHPDSRDRRRRRVMRRCRGSRPCAAARSMDCSSHHEPVPTVAMSLAPWWSAIRRPPRSGAWPNENRGARGYRTIGRSPALGHGDSPLPTLRNPAVIMESDLRDPMSVRAGEPIE